MEVQFGSGVAWGFRTDSGVYTPMQFGILQDISIDMSFNMKELYGMYQFPVAIARGTAKWTGKAKHAQMRARQWNDLFFGQTLTTPAMLTTAFDEAATIPATPYQVTVANSASFVTDLGVKYVVGGVPLVKVASGPTTGQYSVNPATGVYTFAAADTALGVLISYTYTVTTAGSNKIAIANQLLGTQPQFQLNLFQTFNSKVANLQLNACVSSKLSLATKLEDWEVPELDFHILADTSNNVGFLSLSE